MPQILSLRKVLLSAFPSYNLTASQWFFVAITGSNSCAAQFQNQVKANWPICLCFNKKRSLSEQGISSLKWQVPEAVFLISRSPGRLGQRSQRAGGQCASSAGWCGACHRRRKALLGTWKTNAQNDTSQEGLVQHRGMEGCITALNQYFIHFKTVFQTAWLTTHFKLLQLPVITNYFNSNHNQTLHHCSYARRSHTDQVWRCFYSLVLFQQAIFCLHCSHSFPLTLEPLPGSRGRDGSPRVWRRWGKDTSFCGQETLEVCVHQDEISTVGRADMMGDRRVLQETHRCTWG